MVIKPTPEARGARPGPAERVPTSITVCHRLLWVIGLACLAAIGLGRGVLGLPLARSDAHRSRRAPCAGRARFTGGTIRQGRRRDRATQPPERALRPPTICCKPGTPRCASSRMRPWPISFGCRTTTPRPRKLDSWPARSSCAATAFGALRNGFRKRFGSIQVLFRRTAS